MITISAFADEIGPDLRLQMDVCEANGVKAIDVRGIDGVNVSQMDLAKVAEYKKQLDGRGFIVPCIGSPIGKVKIDDDFDAHLDLLARCIEIGKAFGTSRIRIFSFYPPEGGDIMDHRSEVMERMAAMVDLAEKSDAVLLHENENAIYGATPDGVKDLFATIQSERFRSIFDPGNFVVEGLAPYDEAWQAGLGDLTEQFHIKDKVPGEPTCVPAGEGHGQIDKICADLRRRGWGGVMTLEPHMAAAGQFSGFTGPELFAKAVAGLKRVLDQAGIPYH